MLHKRLFEEGSTRRASNSSKKSVDSIRIELKTKTNLGHYKINFEKKTIRRRKKSTIRMLTVALQPLDLDYFLGR